MKRGLSYCRRCHGTGIIRAILDDGGNNCDCLSLTHRQLAIEIEIHRLKAESTRIIDKLIEYERIA